MSPRHDERRMTYGPVIVEPAEVDVDLFGKSLGRCTRADQAEPTCWRSKVDADVALLRTWTSPPTPRRRKGDWPASTDPQRIFFSRRRPPQAADGGRKRAGKGVVSTLPIVAPPTRGRRRGYEDRRDCGSAKRLICEWPTSMGGDNRFIFTTVVLNFTPFPREQAG